MRPLKSKDGLRKKPVAVTLVAITLIFWIKASICKVALTELFPNLVEFVALAMLITNVCGNEVKGTGSKENIPLA